MLLCTDLEKLDIHTGHINISTALSLTSMIRHIVKKWHQLENIGKKIFIH